MFGWERGWKAGEWLEVQSRQRKPRRAVIPLGEQLCGRASAELQGDGQSHPH